MKCGQRSATMFLIAEWCKRPLADRIKRLLWSLSHQFSEQVKNVLHSRRELICRAWTYRGVNKLQLRSKVARKAFRLPRKIECQPSTMRFSFKLLRLIGSKYLFQSNPRRSLRQRLFAGFQKKNKNVYWSIRPLKIVFERRRMRKKYEWQTLDFSTHTPGEL